MALPEIDYYQRPKRAGSEDWRGLILGFAAIVSVVLLGTFGFHYIESWSFFDSLYMTIITLSTVGFSEVHPLSDNGKIFAIILIGLGVGVFSVVFTTFVRKTFEMQLRRVLRRKGMHEQIDLLNDHLIFCGFGRLSRIVLPEVQDEKFRVVIVDENEEHAEEARQAGHLVVCGDATREDALIRAGVERAKSLISLLPSDADNLYVVLSARELNPDLFILSRAEEGVSEKRLKSAGADRVIAPYRIGAQKLADGLRRPYVTDFLDIAASGSHEDLVIEEIRIPKESPLIGQNLKDSGILDLEVMVAAIIPEGGKMSFNPAALSVLEADATLIGLGEKKNLRALERIVLGSANR